MISPQLTQVLTKNKSAKDFVQKPKNDFWYEVVIPGSIAIIKEKHFVCVHPNLHTGNPGGVRIWHPDWIIGNVKDFISNSWYDQYPSENYIKAYNEIMGGKIVGEVNGITELGNVRDFISNSMFDINDYKI